jgi:hypothetical protein
MGKSILFINFKNYIIMIKNRRSIILALENYVKFLRGTHAQYNALTSKDKDTL